MSTVEFYLSQVLPLVVVLGGASFAIGNMLGWLFWSGDRRRARSTEIENESLRHQIRHLRQHNQ